MCVANEVWDFVYRLNHRGEAEVLNASHTGEKNTGEALKQ